MENIQHYLLEWVKWSETGLTLKIVSDWLSVLKLNSCCCLFLDSNSSLFSLKIWGLDLRIALERALG